MSKEITKAVILQEIQDKLKLREFKPASFLFDETVVPVYNIEQHLEEWWSQYKTESITAIGSKGFFVVPPAERWVVARYDVVFMTGAYTIAGVYVRRKNKEPYDASCYLDLKAAQNVSYHIELHTPIVLQSGDYLNVNVDGYTSTGDLRVYLDVMKEYIR